MTTDPTDMFDCPGSNYDAQWKAGDFTVPSGREVRYDWRNELGVEENDARPQDASSRAASSEDDFDYDVRPPTSSESEPSTRDDIEMPVFNPGARQTRDAEPRTAMGDEGYAAQIAADLAYELGWDDSHEILAIVLEESGNKHATARRFRELAEHGASVDELHLAFRLRRSWRECAPAEKLTVSSWHEAMNHAESETPTWWLCLEIIRSFRSVPTLDEVHYAVREVYNDWMADSSASNQLGRYAAYRPSAFFTSYCRSRFREMPDSVDPSALRLLEPVVSYPEDY